MFHKTKTFNKGFTPAAWFPPNVITLKRRLYNTIAQRRGGQGGQARYPPLYSVLLISYSDKMNSRDLENQKKSG